MRINFRQGVVSHQYGGFLNLNGSTGNVDLLALNRPTIVSLAHKDTDYLHAHNNTIFDAWTGPFVSNEEYWLYWEFDSKTFFPTFGITTLEPVFGTQPYYQQDVDSYGIPILTVGRMWFDKTTYTQKVYMGGDMWREVLRVVAAQLTNGNTFISWSANSSSSDFTGTQIGDNSSILAGYVLFDEPKGLGPLIRDDHTFFTLEDQYFTSQSRAEGIRLESNVARAKSNETAIADFTIVAYSGDGIIKTAEYEDTGLTVVGVLSEQLMYQETGTVIIQGVITNPLWDWVAYPKDVGRPLWIGSGPSKGMLVDQDPHVTDVIAHPFGQVPVARVLDKLTVVFEQGLGGKGDAGPPGLPGDLVPATTTTLGVVTLVTPSSDPARAWVITDTDPRLTDARYPLPHVHPASEVTFIPGGGVISNNVQDALVELGNGKVNRSGDTMTGFLTLHDDPINPFHAATKNYVDNLINGVVWLNPICLLNVISDTQNTPPPSPGYSDAYIVAAGGGTGDWSGFVGGTVTIWDDFVWTNIGTIANLNPTGGTRLGIAFTSNTSPSGTFSGHAHHIANYDSGGNFVDFEIPQTESAVYVCSGSDMHAHEQYVFTGTEWVLFGGGQGFTPDGITITQTHGILSVKQFDDEGINDVKFWQGLEPTDLESIYAPIDHIHNAIDVVVEEYLTSPDWGTLVDITSSQINSLNVQDAFEDITDAKAAKTPAYATETDLPSATSVEGMIAYVDDVRTMYYASNDVWIALSSDIDIQTIPYDIGFFVAGTLLPDDIISGFGITRDVHIEDTQSAVAIAVTAATAISTNLTIERTSGPAHLNPTVIGTVEYLPGNKVGIFTWPNPIDLIAGDLIIVRTDATPSDVEDITITLVGCATTAPCSMTTIPS